MKKLIYGISAFMFLTMVSCNKDDFADLNSRPSDLNAPDLMFQTTKVIELMYNNDYTSWFYNNFDYSFPWSQITGVGVGNNDLFVEMGPSGSQALYPSLYSNVRDVRFRIDAIEDEAAKNAMQAIKGVTFPTLIHAYLTRTDLEGSLPYEEAALYLFTNPPLLTPKWDTQEQMFDMWLSELDEAIALLSKSDQWSLGNQDVIYKGDYTKWAKFCNLLKLKIASRLINKDRAKALQIAAEVASSPAGYMDALEDDFIYRRGALYRGTGNGLQPGTGGKNLIEFMVNNKDPRVRFLFTKNGFNAEIVQGFIDNNRELPSYVEQYVEKDANGDFAGWKAPGEPWVRYFGAPLSPDAQFDTNNQDYFQQSERNRLTIGSNQKTYASTSNYSEFVARTGITYVYPTLPGGRIIDNRAKAFPALEVILGSSAETNLLLAEFKLLGANIPGTAQDYFNKGVEYSVRRMDRLMANNGMPYYDEDPVYRTEAEQQAGAAKLRNGEIDDLLMQPAYDLSTNGLEKIYIQQYINYAATPNDVWTTVRRSGIPMTGSTIFPREDFKVSGNELTVPRRFMIQTPTEDQTNFENTYKAMQEQGFTTGTNDPQILSTERIWFDKENPAYGEGPKQ